MAMPLRARFALIAALYSASLTLPAFKPWPTHEGLRGLACLCFGVAYPPWWANPLLFIGCAFLARGESRKACVCGVLATALGSSFLLLNGVSSARVGSAFWVASLAALAVASIDRGRTSGAGRKRSE